MADEVQVEFSGRVTIITINRPQARNAINHAVSVAVAQALDDLDERDDLTVGIITGAVTGGTSTAEGSAAGVAGCCPAGGRSFSVCPDAQLLHMHASIRTANDLTIGRMTTPLCSEADHDAKSAWNPEDPRISQTRRVENS